MSNAALAIAFAFGSIGAVGGLVLFRDEHPFPGALLVSMCTCITSAIGLVFLWLIGMAQP